MNQIDLHKKIDGLLSLGPAKVRYDQVVELSSANEDGKHYFYSKADERWLEWLWGNGFLDEIKQPADDPTRYGLRTPEITYLAKVAEKNPEKVADIILDSDTATTREKFKPELVDQFLRICSELPADQLARVVPKIHQQEWVKTMGNFNRWGFEYEKMFKTLTDASDYENALLLAETVLSVRTKEEIAKTSNGFGTDNPFYFDDFEHTDVFSTLLNVPPEYQEGALRLATKVMSQIVLLGGKDDDPERIFPLKEMFYLFDVDFFTLQPEMAKHISYRDDVKELAAVIKVLIDKVIGDQCSDQQKVRDLYDSIIDSLPDSRAMWRLRLYTLSLCPDAFKDKLKNAFFRLFESKYYSDITSGAEYERALKKGFAVLTDAEQREYVKKTTEYFSDHEKGSEEERWHINAASDIFSVISDHLTEEERENVTTAGFNIDAAYEPVAGVISGGSGFVQSQGPIPQEEFGKLPIEEIIRHFKTDWAPEALREKYKQTDSFLKPHNAEGAGDLLKNDIPERLQAYVDQAGGFFGRDDLDQHYTYAFLRGIEETVKNNRTLARTVNWDGLIDLLVAIKDSGIQKPFEREKRDRDSFDAWLAGWRSVHSGMTDVLQAILREDKEGAIIDFPKYRDRLLDVITYLLDDPEPTPEKEDPKDPIMSSSMGGREQLVSDPFTIAINTVRGRAFQAFVLFIFPDGKDLPEGKKLKEDVKQLYEKVLAKEDTRAVMFLFGHYLIQFYFREIAWIQKLLPQIFPAAPEKAHLYLAAWEGYLANNLYRELFTDPQIEPLYYRGLSIADIKETTRQYFRDPDEGIATHVALAFIHYPDFGFDHPLFKAFWDSGNLEQQKAFVSFLGRSVVSGDNAEVNEFLKKEPRAKKLLKTFWEWALENRGESELFEEFGFWINLEKDIFDSVWLAEQTKRSLEKTQGKLDWDYGLTKSAMDLAKAAPKDMLRITRLIFWDGAVKGDHPRRQFYVEREWFDVFKELYSNPETKTGTYQLIDDLIREGGSPFWGLKSIFEEK